MQIMSSTSSFAIWMAFIFFFSCLISVASEDDFLELLEQYLQPALPLLPPLQGAPWAGGPSKAPA